MLKAFKSFLVLLSLSLSHYSMAQTKTQEITFRGEAILKNGAFFYKESTVMTFRKDHLEKSITKYLTKDDKVVAELKSDFTKSDFLPDTQFIDYRDQYEYSLNFNSDEKKIDLSTKDSIKADKKMSSLKYKEGMMLFQGALNFIGQNIKKLRAKETLEVEFVLPSRHTSMNVIIEPITEDSTDEKLKIRIKAKSALLRLGVPESILIFDNKTVKILQFEGVHSLLDEKDNSQQVIIKYNY